MISVLEKRVMESYTVHKLTKEILELAKNRDIVDAYYDTKLALAVLKKRMDNALKGA